MLLNRAVLLAMVASALSLMASVALIMISAEWSQPTPIAGDASLYREISDAALGGAVPYRDTTVEHLPAMLVPIVGVGAVARLAGLDYVALWAVVAIVAVVASVVIAGSISLDERYQSRFAIAVTPMLPLVLFRLEVFVVLVALLALVAHERARHVAGAAWTVVGSLAKGWPIVLLILPFRRGAPRLAAVGMAVSVSGLALVASLPGFREGRAFTGIHSETVVGNLLLLWRHATGEELGIVGAAGATYVEASLVAIVVNAAIGIVLGLVALVAVLRTTELAALVRACGLATLAVMLVSPLLSAQFVFWLTPFVPLLGRRGRQLAFVAGGLSMLLVALWNPRQVWWAAEVAARNATLLVLAVVWAREVAVGRRGTRRGTGTLQSAA